VQEHQGHPMVMPKPKAKYGMLPERLYPKWLYGQGRR
jgi:hypothetical protein